MAKYDPVVQIYEEDLPRTLFPLDTNLLLMQRAAAELSEFAYERITHDPDLGTERFLPQTRCYASKSGFHVRRTLKLDPVAEFYLYDVVYRHRVPLRARNTGRRRSFGYEFRSGRMVSSAEQFREFRRAVAKAQKQYEYGVKFDIAQYFNSVYHHDLVAWFRDVAKTDEDAALFGRFFREINSGRSVDFLPQGVFPAKVIGSQFLQFLDHSNRLDSDLLLRFMDDVYIFDDSFESVLRDFQLSQRLLGERGLSVNGAKTVLGSVDGMDLRRKINRVKIRLLRRRPFLIFGSGVDESDLGDSGEVDASMTAEEAEFLTQLLESDSIEEEDAELVLTLFRDHSDDVLEHLPGFFRRFPNLSKNLYHFCLNVDDEESLLQIVNEYLSDRGLPTEYQLFWIAKLCEDRLLSAKGVGDVLARLLDHPQATAVSRAKVLEIPERRFGMPDRREEELRTGSSGWLSWSAAAGVRSEKKANRNHVLKYFANGSPVNRLIANCVTAYSDK